MQLLSRTLCATAPILKSAFGALLLGSALLAPIARAQEAPTLSGAQVAAQIAAAQQGSSYVRFRLVHPSGGTMQLQMKERRTASGADVMFQVLFPKERKGEGVVIRAASGRPSGAHFTPPDTLRTINSGDMQEKLFGSDLTYEDVVDSFYSWNNQEFTGTEEVDGVTCQILESKPGKGERSSYSKVRSWIDTKRTIPLRVEKYGSSGQVVRRIDTNKVARAGGRFIPASLTVRSGNSVTQLEGARRPADANYTDADFTNEALKTLVAPKSAD